MYAAPAQVKRGSEWRGVMGATEEKTVYPEALAGPDLAVVERSNQISCIRWG